MENTASQSSQGHKGTKGQFEGHCPEGHRGTRLYRRRCPMPHALRVREAAKTIGWNGG